MPLGHGVQQARAAAAAHLGNQAARFAADGLHVIAVHLHARHAQRGGAPARAFAACHGSRFSGGGNAVVLAHEEHGQTVHHGPVQRLQKGAAIDGPVAKKAHGHLAPPAPLERVRSACRYGQARSHHATQLRPKP